MMSNFHGFQVIGKSPNKTALPSDAKESAGKARKGQHQSTPGKFSYRVGEPCISGPTRAKPHCPVSKAFEDCSVTISL